MKKAPFRVTWSETGSGSGASDDNGICKVLMPRSITTFVIEWGDGTAVGTEFAFRRRAHRVAGTSDDELTQRLENLAFGDPGAEAPTRVREYQQRRGNPQTGKMDDVREEVVAWHDRGVDRPVTQD